MPRKKRDWSLVNEAYVRVCAWCGEPAQWAHIVGRIHDEEVVNPLDIIPLCPFCHDRYDGRRFPRLDIVPALTKEQINRAIQIAGSEGKAARRLRCSRHPEQLPR